MLVMIDITTDITFSQESMKLIYENWLKLKEILLTEKDLTCYDVLSHAQPRVAKKITENAEMVKKPDS